MMEDFRYDLESLQRLFGYSEDYVSRNASKPLDLSKLKGRWRRVMEEAIRYIKTSWIRQPIPLTVRQVHYHLVSTLPSYYRNNENDYKTLTDYLVRARISGLVPWYCITEIESRISEVVPKGIRSVKEAIARAIESIDYEEIGENPWNAMKRHVLVLTEKRELYPQLSWVCDKYYVRLVCPPGETPWSRLYHEHKHWIKEKLDEDHEVYVLFVTDHDPTGLEINRFAWSAFINWFHDDIRGRGSCSTWTK